MENFKIILYVILFPFTIWIMQGLDINRFFKQGMIIQAKLIYLMVAICVSYLVTNFIYDFLK